MADPTRGSTRTAVTAVAVFLGGVILLWTLYLVRHVLLIFYIAVLFTIGVSPAVRWIERMRFGRKRLGRMPTWAAILILYLAILGLIAATIAVVVPPLVSQAFDLWTQLPTYVDDLQRWLVRYRLITHRYTWSEMLRSVPAPGVALSGVLGAIQNVAGAFGAIVTTLVLPYYLLLEAESIERGVLKLFPADRRPRISRLTRDVTFKVSAWLGGQAVLSLVIGVTAGIGLFLLGVPYFYVLALVCAFGELIPVIGPILAAIPAILVALTVSPQTAALTALYFVLQQFVENHFLVPKIMQRQVGVSAVTVIVALLIGTELLGIVGALLAVPTAAIVQVVMQDYLARDDG